ncbi:prepilin-type N-terminal cleavage/methylation domain-containing protein [Ottowia sp.]|uniref:prepilin-type N-terminal cleavage/methylation domain-containing protein n=1 Tax=Ottowia sp. TaxID=1898956 RepID=UPI003A8376EA
MPHKHPADRTPLSRAACAAHHTTRRIARGFTLIELMVVVAIIALGTTVVALALRDGSDALLAREGDRLAAVLESARAQSRTAGVPVLWRATIGGFEFDGLPATAPPLPDRWLDAQTTVVSKDNLVLGPDPIISAQYVVLQRASNGRVQQVTVATDGLRPFRAEQLQ